MVRVVEIARDIKQINVTIKFHVYIVRMQHICADRRGVPFVGMTGWAVNSIVNTIKGSSPFLPKKIHYYTHINTYTAKSNIKP
jgi:hypothetical protein